MPILNKVDRELLEASRGIEKKKREIKAVAGNWLLERTKPAGPQPAKPAGPQPAKPASPASKASKPSQQGRQAQPARPASLARQ
ncbi:hypothetical protein FCV25MIE_13418 [Fagus crenata]